jgi:uncharacterized protein
MGLQDIVRFLAPKEDHFFDFLEKQADAAHRGALAMSELKNGTAQAATDKIQEIEHEGDGLFRGLEDALAKTFVTPIDREDLHKLSDELDDILDLTNGAARAYSLYGVKKTTEPMIALIDILIRSTEILKNAMPLLRKHQYLQLTEATRATRKLEKEADAVYRKAVSDLFRDDAIDAKVLLREKAVLEDLENAIDHCTYVASTLGLLAVKHG